MALYIRFVTMLALGLLGLGVVLKILLDQVFKEWDALTALKEYFQDLSTDRGFINSKRTEDVLMEVEHGKPRELTTRLIDKRREELNAMDEVESRLNLPLSAAAASPSPAAASGRNPIYQEDWGQN